MKNKPMIEERMPEKLKMVISKDNENFETLYEIMEKITDEKLLTYIAKGDFNDDVRVAATTRINDYDILVDLALNEANDFVRETAVDVLATEPEYEELMKHIVTYDSSARVRSSAAGAIRDRTLCRYIAKFDPEPWVREMIVQYSDDIDLLADAAEYDSCSEVSCRAKERLFSM